MSNLFTRADSQAIKGIAILFVMFKHLLGDAEDYGDHEVVLWFLSQETFHDICYYLTISLPMFAFVTVYGIAYKMGTTNPDRAGTERMIVKQFSNLMIPFWVVFVIAQIVCNLTGVKTYGDFYGGGYRGAMYFVLDALGLAWAMDEWPLNPTWWYMSFAMMLICLAPLMAKGAERFGFVFFIAVLLFCRMSGFANTYCFNYLTLGILGAVFYYSDIFGLIDKWFGKNLRTKAVLFVLIIFLLVTGYALKLKGGWTDMEYAVAVPAMMILQQQFLSRIKPVTAAFAFIGKHSMNLFLIHTFFNSFFCHDFIFSFKYWPLIFLVSLGLSLITSIVLEKFKDITKINTLGKKIAAKVDAMGIKQ